MYVCQRMVFVVFNTRSTDLLTKRLDSAQQTLVVQQIAQTAN